MNAGAPTPAALESFEHFQAEPWSERARPELRASGETARKRDPSSRSQLTPQELQIVRLVAEGLANKVAAEMFLSKRTIDYHLSQRLTKLKITSRTELADSISATGTPDKNGRGRLGLLDEPRHS